MGQKGGGWALDGHLPASGQLTIKRSVVGSQELRLDLQGTTQSGLSSCYALQSLLLTPSPEAILWDHVFLSPIYILITRDVLVNNSRSWRWPLRISVLSQLPRLPSWILTPLNILSITLTTNPLWNCTLQSLPSSFMLLLAHHLA